ncbi:hypothetical protein DPMN_154186 [Dreissena polymorpha]|uniref:Uncharacterized protein n=1 Tax=Dreissena polymorpha TaxID=45954 RepID=A0A9D4J9M7_DREPO|nr:hypothetical protein DPMN_154186 [Dreissena polymorpha]
MVKNECMALYIGFSCLDSWLGFIEKYVNGEIYKAFLPVQIYLRTYLGYENLELSVELDEEDFKVCVQTITDQLTALLKDRPRDSKIITNVNTTTTTLRSPLEMPPNTFITADRTKVEYEVRSPHEKTLKQFTKVEPIQF